MRAAPITVRSDSILSRPWARSRKVSPSWKPTKPRMVDLNKSARKTRK